MLSINNQRIPNRQKILLGLLRYSSIALLLPGLAFADDNNLRLPTNVPSLKASSGDRVLDSYERRNDTYRKESEKVESELVDEISKAENLRVEIAKLKATREQMLEKKRLLEVWKNATFILASDRTAMAINTPRENQFRLLGRAQLHHADTAKKIAQRYSIPLIQHNLSNLEELSMSMVDGESFSANAADQLRQYWKVRQYLPSNIAESTPFLVFRDQEVSQLRIGYFLGVRKDSFEFVSTQGKHELIHRNRVESGSARLGSRAEILVEPETDLMDVAALEIARALSIQSTSPAFHSVAIHVKVDELAEALALSKKIDETENDRVIDLLSRLSGQKYVPDQRKEPTRILRQYANVLHDELSRRLVQVGVPVGNREDLDTLESERELASSEQFDKRRYHFATSASHVVTAAVGKPENGGRFRISIRLSDLNTQQVLLEFNSDIGRRMESYASNHFVHNGPLGILFDKDVANHRSNNSQQEALQLEPLGSNHFEPRLGTFVKSGQQVKFYDLFGNASTPLDSARYERKPIQDPADIPADQKLRWLTWELAQASLPMAGRVRRVDGDEIEINLGKNQGVSDGAVFRVMRYDSSNGRSTQRILPMEVKADTIGMNSTVAMLQKDGLSALWEDLQVEIDDVVLQRGMSDPRVRICFPSASTTLMPGETAKKWKTVFKNPQQVRRLNLSMSQVGEQLTLKMIQGLQAQGISNISSDPTDPTHEIVGIISPVDATPDCSRFAIQFSVKSIQDDRVIKIVSPIRVSEGDVRNWQP